MKYAKYAVLFILAVSLSSLSALAKDKNRGNLKVSQASIIGDTKLKPGDYRLEWEGSADNLQVKILQYGKTVGTATAKLVEIAKPAVTDEVDSEQRGEERIIEQVKFRNRNQSIVFTSSQVAEQR